MQRKEKKVYGQIGLIDKEMADPAVLAPNDHKGRHFVPFGKAVWASNANPGSCSFRHAFDLLQNETPRRIESTRQRQIQGPSYCEVRYAT